MNNTLEIPVNPIRTRVSQGAKRKILLVDEDPAIRYVLVRLLS